MTGYPNGYWPNVRGVVSLVIHHSEVITRAAHTANEVAILGPNTDSLSQFKLDAALRDIEQQHVALGRVIPNLRELTEAARRVSSVQPDE